MPDTPNPPTEPRAQRFPFLTAVGAIAVLFLFVGLMVWLYREPDPLAEPESTEPKPDPATKLAEIRAKNTAVLDANPGTGAKMSASTATEQLLNSLKSPKDTLPFPMPEPASPPATKPKDAKKP